jgi:GT2 family glycosyltransferase
MSPSPDSVLAVTVIVPTYRGAERVARLLGELEQQTLPADRFEVIIVDDGSPEGLELAAVPDFARILRLEDNVGPGPARNAGVAQARARIVAFTDDDCSPDPTWLEELLAGFTGPDVVGVGGQMAPQSNHGPGVAFDFQLAKNPWLPLSGELSGSPTRLGRLKLYARSQLGEGHELRSGETAFAFAGGSTAFLRDALVSAGGFHPALRTSEDIEVCMRVRERHPDHRLVYRPEARVRHHIDASLGTLVHRYRIWGMGLLDFSDVTGAAPVVYPTPLLFGAGLLASRGRPGRLALALAIPVATYPRWVRRAISRRRPREVLNCYVQLATETASNLGLAEAVAARARGDSDRVRKASLTRYDAPGT